MYITNFTDTASLVVSYSYNETRKTAYAIMDKAYEYPLEALASGLKLLQLKDDVLTVATVATVSVAYPSVAIGVASLAGLAYAIEYTSRGTHYWSDVVLGGALFSADLLSHLNVVSGLAVNIAKAKDDLLVRTICTGAFFAFKKDFLSEEKAHTALAALRVACLIPMVRKGINTFIDTLGDATFPVAEQRPSFWKSLWNQKERTKLYTHVTNKAGRHVWDIVASYIKPTNTLGFFDYLAGLTTRLRTSTLRTGEAVISLVQGSNHFAEEALSYAHAGTGFELVDPDDAVEADYVTIDMDNGSEEVAMDAIAPVAPTSAPELTVEQIVQTEYHVVSMNEVKAEAKAEETATSQGPAALPMNADAIDASFIMVDEPEEFEIGFEKDALFVEPPFSKKVYPAKPSPCPNEVTTCMAAYSQLFIAPAA